MSEAAAQIALFVLAAVSGVTKSDQDLSYMVGERPDTDRSGATRLLASLPKPVACRAVLREQALQVTF
jgi:hypothetical protein